MEENDYRNSRRQQAKRPALVFLDGDLIAAPIPLERNEVTLGRALEADVRVNDARASRLHARITLERSAGESEMIYRLVDLDSTNGTLLNGHPVSEALLEDGDKIVIGKHILRFEFLDDIDHEFHRQIHRLLVHDELTGLLTSKSFFSELRRESARAEREERPFCVLMMDLDFFKDVNDRYGHLVGSRTLEEVGTVITRSLRAGDVAARFGGEEFAAFMLDADPAQGFVAAERVRRGIEAAHFSATRHGAPEDGERTHHITISIGVASFPDHSRDPIELVEMADAALYRAKRLGRNQVCLHRTPAAKVAEQTRHSTHAPHE